MIFTIILYFQSFPAKRSSKTSHVWSQVLPSGQYWTSFLEDFVLQLYRTIKKKFYTNDAWRQAEDSETD